MSGLLSTLAPWGLILVQLAVAVLCGGIIGYQREMLDRPAGFRTHVLVCVGSALYMVVSASVAGNLYDPGRIAAQVASGIGFLGAGTIIKQGSIVRGLTTAASLWAVAGIGLAAGYGGRLLIVALIGTLVVLLSLTLLKSIELAHFERGFPCTITLTLVEPRDHISRLREVLTKHHMEIRGFAIQELPDARTEVTVDVRAPSQTMLEDAAEVLVRDEGITGVRWECR